MSAAEQVAELEAEVKQLRAMSALYELNPINVRYVKLKKFCDITGYTVSAIEQKVKAGKWVRGVHVVIAPDGNQQVDLLAFQTWVRGKLLPEDIEACNAWVDV